MKHRELKKKLPLLDIWRVYRSIIAFKSDTRSIFFYFFPKSKKDNLLKDEAKEYREATAIYLSLTDAQITLALEKQELVEVHYNDKEI